jgi:hypothetical protein
MNHTIFSLCIYNLFIKHVYTHITSPYRFPIVIKYLYILTMITNFLEFSLSLVQLRSHSVDECQWQETALNVPMISLLRSPCTITCLKTRIFSRPKFWVTFSIVMAVFPESCVKCAMDYRPHCNKYIPAHTITHKADEPPCPIERFHVCVPRYLQWFLQSVDSQEDRARSRGEIWTTHEA